MAVELVIGEPARAGRLAIRRLLKGPVPRRSRMVLDYTGRGSRLLTDAERWTSTRFDLVWLDLADRRRPCGLLAFDERTFLQPAADALVRDVARHLELPCDGELVSTIVSAWRSLAMLAPAPLRAVSASLRAGHPRVDTGASIETGRTTEILELIDAAHALPAIRDLADAEPPSALQDPGPKSALIWIEMPTEAFRPVESRLVRAFANATALAWAKAEVTAGRQPIVAGLYPTADCAELATRWDAVIGGEGHFIAAGLMRLPTELPAGLRSWRGIADRIVVVPSLGPNEGDAHGDWLSAHDRSILAGLDRDSAWTFDPKSRRALVVGLKLEEPGSTWVDEVKRDASRRHRLAFGSLPARERAARRRDPYQRIADRGVLRSAWLKVRRNTGRSAGCDGMTKREFGSRAQHHLADLRDELIARRYRPKPVVRIRQPKADGDSRKLAICTIRDRVAQQAALIVLHDEVDHTFSPSSFAFRPGRSVHDAIESVRAAITSGLGWVARTDVRKCFATVDHEILRRMLGERFGNPDIVRLLMGWVEADVVGDDVATTGWVGIEQGAPISPFLANLYLDALDRALDRRDIRFARYADDIVLFAATAEDADEALRLVASVLRSTLAMSPKSAKTHRFAPGEPIEFLGFRFENDDVHPGADRCDRVVAKLRRLLIELADDSDGPLVRTESMARYNAIVRGFRNYYGLPDSPACDLALESCEFRVEQLAQRLLPLRVSGDPVWAARERFCAAEPVEVDLSRVVPYVALQPGEPLPDPPADTGRDRPSPLTDDEPSASPGEGDAEEAEQGELPAIGAATNGRLDVFMHGALVSVDRAHTEVRLSGRRRPREGYPIDDLRAVLVHGLHSRVSSELMLALGRRGVLLAVIGAGATEPAVSASHMGQCARLRARQALFAESESGAEVARTLVESKIGNQSATLKYFAKYQRRRRTPLAPKLADSAAKLCEIRERVLAVDLTLPRSRARLMGFEGQAAAVYWSASRLLVPDEAGFEARQGRGAVDPFNQALNLVYALLYGEVWSAVTAFGLDPHFACLHGRERDSGSLVFDMIEPLRAPCGDRLLLGLFGRGFRCDVARDGRLRSRSKRTIVRAFRRQWERSVAWGRQRVPLSEAVDLQVRSFVAELRCESRFRAYRMKW